MLPIAVSINRAAKTTGLTYTLPDGETASLAWDGSMVRGDALVVSINVTVFGLAVRDCVEWTQGILKMGVEQDREFPRSFEQEFKLATGAPPSSLFTFETPAWDANEEQGIEARPGFPGGSYRQAGDTITIDRAGFVVPLDEWLYFVRALRTWTDLVLGLPREP